MKKNRMGILLVITIIALILVVSVAPSFLSILNVTNIYMTVSAGTTTVSKTLDIDISYKSGEAPYQTCLDLMGGWNYDYYWSGFKSLPNTKATVTTNYYDINGMKRGGNVVSGLTCTYYFYGWPPGSRDYTGTLPMLFIKVHGAKVTIPVETRRMNVKVEISGLVSYSGSKTISIRIDVAEPVKHILTISATTGGYTNPYTGKHSYTEGTSAVVKAIPKEGYEFQYWLLDGKKYTGNPITVTMNSDHTLRAVFQVEVISTPPAPPTDIWNAITTAWDRLWNWLKTLFGLNLCSGKLSIITGDSAYPGDTFTHAFTLQNNKTVMIPDSDYQDGAASFAYTVWMVTDSSGNIIYKGDVNEVSLASGESKDITVSWQIPDDLKVGKYAVSAVLIEIPMHWDRTSQSWIQDETVIIDKQAVELNVESITPPPQPNDIWSQIQEWWQNLIGWLKNLFGWS